MVFQKSEFDLVHFPGISGHFQRQTSLGPVELVTMRNLWNWSHNFWTCGIGHNFFQAIVELVTIFGTNSTNSMRVLDLVTDKKSLWNRAQLGKKLSEFENVDCDLFQYY